MKKGVYKVRCDRSGFLVDSDKCRMQWDGLFVRKDLWEPRHPQDTISSVKQQAVPAHPRPETITFIDPLSVTADDL